MTLRISQIQTPDYGSIEPHILPHDLKTLSKEDLVGLCYRLSEALDNCADADEVAYARRADAVEILRWAAGKTGEDDDLIGQAIELLEE